MDPDHTLDMDDRCSTCRAPIRWTITQAGARMPVDPTPREDGNVVVESDLLGETRSRMALAGDWPRYVAHFATCPDAAGHRRRRT